MSDLQAKVGGVRPVVVKVGDHYEGATLGPGNTIDFWTTDVDARWRTEGKLPTPLHGSGAVTGGRVDGADHAAFVVSAGKDAVSFMRAQGHWGRVEWGEGTLGVNTSGADENPLNTHSRLGDGKLWVAIVDDGTDLRVSGNTWVEQPWVVEDAGAVNFMPAGYPLRTDGTKDPVQAGPLGAVETDGYAAFAVKDSLTVCAMERASVTCSLPDKVAKQVNATYVVLDGRGVRTTRTASLGDIRHGNAWARPDLATSVKNGVHVAQPGMSLSNGPFTCGPGSSRDQREVEDSVECVGAAGEFTLDSSVLRLHPAPAQ